MQAKNVGGFLRGVGNFPFILLKKKGCRFAMKKLLTALAVMLVCSNFVFADEIGNAEQIIEMTENKVILNIQKQPLNENSKQKIVLNVNVNGKVKVNPLANTYEVE